MVRCTFLLVPTCLLITPNSVIPQAMEVSRGVFVLRGVPDEALCLALQKQKITHVVDLRRDGEPGLNDHWESTYLQELGIHYIRFAVRKAPPAGDFTFIRNFLNDLPKGSKVLFHCGDGNRAAAVICPWLVLDKGLPMEGALTLAREAGLQLPETEAAVRHYLAERGKA